MRHTVQDREGLETWEELQLRHTHLELRKELKNVEVIAELEEWELQRYFTALDRGASLVSLEMAPPVVVTEPQPQAAPLSWLASMCACFGRPRPAPPSSA